MKNKKITRLKIEYQLLNSEIMKEILYQFNVDDY